ncbi:S1 family peptidase [Bradyrhizobium elkanii]|uniref:S1 family peptidase n=1 Tax=Bradyrhizobium elkanii TaxID=29448 RepID=UPI0012FE0D27|nr:serine protease [Bradyrhizobium elkanii]
MPASPASCCSVYLEILVQTPTGPLQFGFATGFLYAGPNATRWLVTNWHVVTGRWPDDPGHCTGKQPQSPGWLRFKVENPAGSGWQEIELALYDANGPTWIEGGREQGVDLALIRLEDPPRFPLPLSQTFAPSSSVRLQPGLDVVIVGHPFELGKHAPSAIWKAAMVASDRDTAENGNPWILLDAPGVPGMSGSPVYRRVNRPSKAGIERGPANAVLHVPDREKGVSLELLGVYAGAVGDKRLEELRLGRVFPIELVEDLLRRRERGRNPYPPEFAAQ